MANEDPKDKLIKQLQESIDRLNAENIELKSEIQTRDALGYIADPSGIAQRTVNIIKDLTRENQTLKSENANLHGVVDRCLQAEQEHFFQSRENAQENINMLEGKNDEVGKAPALIQAILVSTEVLQNAAVDKYQHSVQLLSNPQSNSIKQVHLKIVTMIRLREISAIEKLGFILATSAYCLINDPSMVATDTLLECRVYGEPKAKTLKRLTDAWIAEHLRPNLSISTLREALSLAQKFFQSGLTQQEYIFHYPNIRERRLRDAISWYEIFEQVAAQLSDEIKTKLQKELEASINVQIF